MTTSRRRTLAGVGFILTGAAVIQWSATLVIPAFGVVSPMAASGWRFLVGGPVLWALARPKPWRWTRSQLAGTVALGLSTAAMNLCFYQAIERISLGSAVAIEYLGPFFVAAVGRRTWRHLAFVALAGAGVWALARPGGGITLVGAVFALGSGTFWAAYAFASHRVGGTTDGFGGLAVAMTLSALVTLPFSLRALPQIGAHPAVLARLAVVGILAIVLGFGAELEALRRIRPTIVSVLLALDPAVAFVLGWLVLGQGVDALDLLGLALVVAAGIGVTVDVTREPAGGLTRLEG